MSSTICFNLDQSKILSSGNGLMRLLHGIQYRWCLCALNVPVLYVIITDSDMKHLHIILHECMWMQMFKLASTRSSLSKEKFSLSQNCSAL